MGADLQGHKEEGNQPPPQPHYVRVTIAPYSHAEVRDLLSAARKEFSKTTDPKRWAWAPVLQEPQPDKNIWVIDFSFRDIKDAVIFSLKYSR